MINIFYHPNYFKTKRIFFTKQLRYSILVSPLIYAGYKLHLPLSKNLIFSGPQQRMRHLTKMFPRKDFSINKNRYDNSYFVQYDSWSESILSEILNTNKNSKIIVGPLYDIEYSNKLNKIVKSFPNVKKLVASNSAYKSNLNWPGENITKENLVICPSGIIGNLNVVKKEKKNNKCLIYFKKRSSKDLELVTRFLNEKNVDFEILKYGEYKNNELNKISSESSFGIIINGTESQGFAIQDLMAINLPLLVWDKEESSYGGVDFKGTSVPYWSDNCGIKVNDFKELTNKFTEFINNLEKFNPVKLVEEELTYEVTRKKLLNLFQSF